MFGFDEEEESQPEKEICPGETNCFEFAVAKSEGGTGLEACQGCELLPTKHSNPSAGRCPGETKCSDFLSAAGKTRAEKVENACWACPKFSTKPKHPADKNTPRCPGMSCTRFRQAPGNTWEEKAEDACPLCPRCRGNAPVNPESESAAVEPASEFERIINRVRWMRLEQDAGTLNHYRITELEFRAMLYFNFCYEKYSRRSEVMQRFFIERSVERTEELLTALGVLTRKQI